MKKPEDKLICQLCKQPITDSYTTYTFEDGEDFIMCDHCNTYFKRLMDHCDTYFKQLMDREEEA